jgi:hypothetical protein
MISSLDESLDLPGDPSGEPGWQREEEFCTCPIFPLKI